MSEVAEKKGLSEEHKRKMAEGRARAKAEREAKKAAKEAKATSVVDDDLAALEIEVSYRGHCICGERVGRRKGSKSGKAHCLRYLNGSTPSAECQKNLDGELFLWGPPPPKKIVSEKIEN